MLLPNTAQWPVRQAELAASESAFVYHDTRKRSPVF